MKRRPPRRSFARRRAERGPGWRTAGIIALIAFWWITEPIAIPITSLCCRFGDGASRCLSQPDIWLPHRFCTNARMSRAQAASRLPQCVECAQARKARASEQEGEEREQKNRSRKTGKRQSRRRGAPTAQPRSNGSPGFPVGRSLRGCYWMCVLHSPALKSRACRHAFLPVRSIIVALASVFLCAFPLAYTND